MTELTPQARLLQAHRRAEDPDSSDSNALITIGGGYILVNASGDGIDSNGNVVITRRHGACERT